MTQAVDSRDLVLVLNAGSSSLKFELLARGPEWRSRLRGAVRDIGRPACALEWGGAAAEPLADVDSHAAAARRVLERLEADPALGVAADTLALTAHRVVHGGDAYATPQRVTSAVRARLGELAPLAPLHNPFALAVLDVVTQRYASVPAIAVFDTAFFRHLPEHARRYAVPASWHADAHVERYGFHGIAHEFMRDRIAALTGTRTVPARTVTLQLGQGCSMTALRDGAPVETSMGFTPNEGLVMGTRSGDVDPGVVTHMMRRGLDADALDTALNREAGLLGLSGASDDMGELVGLERDGHAGARLAIAAFCHRIHKYLGAYAAVLGGLDAVVFGGGIGENAPDVRARICAGLEWLGLELDPERNARADAPERCISAAGSRIVVFVVAVREEEAMARAAAAQLEGDARATP